jgi:hypothetical protein
MKNIFLFLSAAALLIAGAVSLPGRGLAQEVATPQSNLPPEVVQFQKLEDKWSEAIEKRDQYGLELLMSPVFIDISSAGDVTTRDQQVSLLFQKNAPEPVSMEQRVVNVRVIEDVAVVDGTYIVKRKQNGVIREERGIFTHIYQHARGNWICVHAQRTAVVEQADQKPKSTKKSNAELPFRIPLFHPGQQSSQPAPDPGSNPAPQQ